MTTFPNGYDLRFLLPKDYPYDANLLNTMSRSYFFELYGPAIEDRLSLRYDIHRFLMNVISSTVLLQPNTPGVSQSDIFFNKIFTDAGLPKHRRPTWSANTNMRITEYLRRERVIHYEELDKHAYDWSTLENYLDTTITYFLDTLFRPDKTHPYHIIELATAGKILCERLFEMRMADMSGARTEPTS